MGISVSVKNSRPHERQGLLQPLHRDKRAHTSQLALVAAKDKLNKCVKTNSKPHVTLKYFPREEYFNIEIHECRIHKIRVLQMELKSSSTTYQLCELGK